MLSDDARNAVNRNKAAEDQPGPLQCAEADHDSQDRKQHDSLKPRLVKLAGMTWKVERVIGKHHRPGHALIRRPAPQLAVDEVGQPPEKQSDRPDRGGDIAERQDWEVVLPAKQYHRGDAAQEAAVKRHAALPQFENLGGMLNEKRKIVEQHVAGAA